MKWNVSGGDADELERMLQPKTHQQQFGTLLVILVAGHPIPLTGFSRGSNLKPPLA